MANWFIALEVPPADWFARVANPPPGVRLFHPQDLHLTVAFLGPVGEERARRAFELAGGWPTPRQRVRLGAVVPMGRKSHPSAFSAVLEAGVEQVVSGISAVRDAMADAAQAPREHRAPLPHITVARPSRSVHGAALRSAIAWALSLQLDTPEISLSAISLYTRAEAPSERSFCVVDTYSLPTNSNLG